MPTTLPTASLIEIIVEDFFIPDVVLLAGQTINQRNSRKFSNLNNQRFPVSAYPHRRSTMRFLKIYIAVTIRESEFCSDLKMFPVKSQCCKTKRIPTGLKAIYPNISKTDFNLHNISLLGVCTEYQNHNRSYLQYRL